VKTEGTGCCFMHGTALDGRPLMEVAMAGELLEDYWTEDGFAKEIKKAERTLRKWREQKIGPPYANLGKTVIYPKPGARDWVALVRQPVRTKRNVRA
jgi:hypothetical protein